MFLKSFKQGFGTSSSADDVVDNVGMFNRLHDFSVASVSDVKVLVELKSAEIAHKSQIVRSPCFGRVS